MPGPMALSPAECEQYDRVDREGKLGAMASPHVHFDDPYCPRPGCGHGMEWIDFKLELYGDPDGVAAPIVRSWWEGLGFVGRCPNCARRVRFTTLRMRPLDDDEAERFPRLPENWHEVAQSA